jgi:hypothetical protein
MEWLQSMSGWPSAKLLFYRVARDGASLLIAVPQVRFWVSMTYLNEAIRTCMTYRGTN